MSITRSLVAVAAIAMGAAPGALCQGKTILVGPTFGITSAKVTGDNQEDASRRAGLRLGGFASISLGEKFAIQPEITLTSKGSKWSDQDAEIKIRYLQIPILARYKFGSSASRFAPIVMAGPVFGLKTGCTLTVDGDDMECNDQTTSVAGSDFGVVFGAGAEIGQAQFSLRYDLGLKNINGDGAANVKNQTLKVTVGYGFRIGR